MQALSYRQDHVHGGLLLLCLRPRTISIRMTQQMLSSARLHLIAVLGHDTSMHYCCYVHGLGLSIFSLIAPDPALTPYIRCTTLGPTGVWQQV